MHHATLPRLGRLMASLALTLALAACDPITFTAAPSPGQTAAGSGVVEKWPAPSDPLARAAAAGLVPETVEHLAFHVHAHLDVFIDGAQVVVPAGIGINISDPNVKQGPGPGGATAYGGITGCAQPCISPLHTHDVTGILHTESESTTPNTLGQFFTEWGVTLSSTCVGEYCSPGTPVAFYLNGAHFSGDPTTIQLTDHLEIAIVIGTPPPVIPATADFSQA
jgi:hypothetical protein